MNLGFNAVKDRAAQSCCCQNYRGGREWRVVIRCAAGCSLYLSFVSVKRTCRCTRGSYLQSKEWSENENTAQQQSVRTAAHMQPRLASTHE